MSTAMDSYLKQQYLSEDYLHYYGANDRETLAYVHALEALANNKKFIMRNNYTNLRKRVRQAQNAFRSSAQDEKVANDIISGKIFQSLGRIGYSGGTISGLPTPQTIEECRAIIKNVDESEASAAQFAEKLYEVSSMITNQSKDVLEHLAREAIEEVVSVSGSSKHLGGMKATMSSGGTAKQAILAAILSKHNQSFFQLKAKSGSVHTDVMKMITAAESLPEPSSLGRSYSVATGSSKNIVGTASGENEIIKVLKDKILKWLTEIEKSTAEAAIVEATLKGNKEFFSKLGDVEKIIEKTGNKNVSCRFIPDERQKRWINQSGIMVGKRTSKSYKSDVSIFSNESQAVGQLGISVKDYKALSITGNEGVFSVSGNLDIQKGTPLLTLLMREANLSSQRIHQLFQFLGAHSYDKDGISSSWDRTWERVIQYLSYRMFIDALVGLESSLDTVTYLAINGYIYDVIGFVESFMDSSSTVKISEYLGKYNTSQSTGGLARQSYVNLNTWIEPAQRSLPSALVRSRKAEAAIANLLGRTKITISLNLLRMQGLRALNA